MMQNQIENITNRGTLVVPLLRLWSGKKHVQPEELGVDLPKGVVTPGSKRIFPPDGIKPMETIKSRMMTAIEKVSVQYGRGIYLVDEDQLDDLTANLEALRQEFDDEVSHLERTYDQQFADWVQTVNPPEWEECIRRAKVPAGEATGKYAFRYSLLRVSAPEHLPEANDEILTGLRGQLWGELAEMAEASAKYLNGKEKVTQRGKSPFKRIAEKAIALSFIDPAARKLAGHIDSVLEQLPKTGPIEGNDLTTLQVLISHLADPNRAISLAKAFNAPASDELDADEDAQSDLDDEVGEAADDAGADDESEAEEAETPPQVEVESAKPRRWF